MYGHNISASIAGKIYDMTEGWVSAIYLVMQRYAEIGRLEPGESIERLIETTVMSRYTDKEVKILNSLCVLDSFSPKQAVYVTEDIEMERIIKKLSYRNSFIRYDEIEGVYRIHNIFNSYLKKHLEIELNNHHKIIYDMKPRLKGVRFCELIDIKRFKDASIENGNIIVWDSLCQITINEIFNIIER